LAQWKGERGGKKNVRGRQAILKNRDEVPEKKGKTELKTEPKRKEEGTPKDVSTTSETT